MCLACTKLDDDCSHLPFDTYPRGKNKLDKGTDDQMVICRQFEHAKEEKPEEP
jgi:hypothetical protein